MSLNLKSLIGKLNETTREALNSAVGLCVSRMYYDIEIEHYLLKAIEVNDNDVALILKHYSVDRPRLTMELERSINNFKTGNVRPPAFSPMLVKMMAEAWLIGSIDFNAGDVRTGFTLLALLMNAELVQFATAVCGELKRIDPDSLRRDFYMIVANSREIQTTLALDGEKCGTTSDRSAKGSDKALLSDADLARLAKALIRELMPAEPERLPREFDPHAENSREVQVVGNGEMASVDPGS